jgi:hypothetical protein
MKWKFAYLFERKRLWPNLRYFSFISLEGPGKITNSLRIERLLQDFNPGVPRYEAGMLITVLYFFCFSVFFIYFTFRLIRYSGLCILGRAHTYILHPQSVLTTQHRRINTSHAMRGHLIRSQRSERVLSLLRLSHIPGRKSGEISAVLPAIRTEFFSWFPSVSPGQFNEPCSIPSHSWSCFIRRVLNLRMYQRCHVTKDSI